MERGRGGRAARKRPEWWSWALLIIGVSAASFSAILIRYARGAEPLALSFWRCGAAVVALGAFARVPRGTRRVDLHLPAIAGAFLAVHFATWITSLELTTVASSVLLVSTTPVFVAIAARVLFDKRLPAVGWLGISLSVAGVGFVGGGGFGGSSSLGDSLALAGGAAAAGYVLAGTLARRKLGIALYATSTYGVAACLLLVVCVLERVPLWGYPGGTWWAIAGMVAGPQLLGHTVINFVLGELDATTVSVVIMAEPIIATALAFVAFGEVPSALIYPGGAAILVGIYLVSTLRQPPLVGPA